MLMYAVSNNRIYLDFRMSTSSCTCAGTVDVPLAVSEALGAGACAAGAVDWMPGDGGAKSGWDGA